MRKTSWAHAVAVVSTFSFQASVALAADSSHAALAIDRRDGERYGWAVDYGSADDARARASSECSRLGGKCQVVLEFTGGCGAYAVERGNGSLYGWGTANRREDAEARAVAEARKRGGKDVLVRVWGCNSGELQAAKAAPATPSPNPDGGVWFLYAMRMTVKNSTEKLCFVSNAFYVPGVAEETNGEWRFKPSAGGKLRPYVAKFDAGVKRRYATAAADLEGGWLGGNEITTLSPKMPGLAPAKRRSKMADGAAAVKQDCAQRGYEIVPITL